MIRNHGQTSIREQRRRLFHGFDGRRVDDDVAFVVIIDGGRQKFILLARPALTNDVAQIRPMEAHYELGGIVQMKLRQNIVPHGSGGAGGERGDRRIRKPFAQGT